jgi:glycerol-1-phosphate dehydrogenase [NAD(P)+]
LAVTSGPSDPAPRPIPGELDLDALRARLASADPGGRLRPLGMGRIVIDADALAALPEIVRGIRRDGDVVMLTDEAPMHRGDDDLKPAVLALLGRSFPARWHVVHGHAAQLHAEEQSIVEAMAGLEGAGCVVVVGSGTITDIGKEATRLSGGIPLVLVQTAVSVNAFSDDMAVLFVDGVKRTASSRWPDALLVDLGVIADAPPGMNRAGYGELASMHTAPADWYLAWATGMDDTYEQAPVDLARAHHRELLAAAAGVHDVQRGAVELLVHEMTLSGISLGVAGRTTPLSGSEHLVSHMLDMEGAASGREAAFHGAQVGVGSILMAIAWRQAIDRWSASGFDLGRMYPSPADVEPRVRAAFARLDPGGRASDECWRDYSRKLANWHAARPRFEAFVAEWPRHRAVLDGIVGDPAVLARAIVAAGSPARFSELAPPVGADVARWALGNCQLMRDRLTLVDLRFLEGTWEEADVESVLEVAAGLGAGL